MARNLEARFREGLKKEIARIREETRANAWRPQVSNSKGQNTLQLAWWSLGKPENQKELEPEHRDGLEQRASNLYRQKWVGLTVSNVSPFEREAINNFMRPYSKRELWHFEVKFSESDGEAGYHKTSSFGFWFRDVETHAAFVAMLDAIPPRTQVFWFGDAADPDAVTRLVDGKNHMITYGRERTVLTVPSLSDSELVLLQMFVG